MPGPGSRSDATRSAAPVVAGAVTRILEARDREDARFLEEDPVRDDWHREHGRERVADPDFHVAAHTWDVTSAHGPSGPIQIAYLGYPYNFVCRSPDAVPARIVQLETGGLLAALVQARLYLDLCEKGQLDNRGIHPVSPKAQRFVYENWLKTMSARGIDPTERFAHDPETLRAAQHDDWFIEHTEPQLATPLNELEELMAHFVDQRTRFVKTATVSGT